jgi:hypothetical protein
MKLGGNGVLKRRRFIQILFKNQNMKILETIIQKTIQTLYGVDFIPEITPAPKKELGEYCIGVFQLAKTT